MQRTQQYSAFSLLPKRTQLSAAHAYIVTGSQKKISVIE